jgi:hypothetical protein
LDRPRHSLANRIVCGATNIIHSWFQFVKSLETDESDGERWEMREMNWMMRASVHFRRMAAGTFNLAGRCLWFGDCWIRAGWKWRLQALDLLTPIFNYSPVRSPPTIDNLILEGILIKKQTHVPWHHHHHQRACKCATHNSHTCLYFTFVGPLIIQHRPLKLLHAAPRLLFKYLCCLTCLADFRIHKFARNSNPRLAHSWPLLFILDNSAVGFAMAWTCYFLSLPFAHI